MGASRRLPLLGTSCMCNGGGTYLLTIASSHLIVGEKSTMHMDISEETLGAKKLMNNVMDLHNNSPMFNVHPALLMSTDDSNLFIFEGKTKHESAWHIHAQSCNTSLRSTFSAEIGGTDHLNGLRIRATHTMCGVGIMAPLYVTVYGLNERELPAADFPSGVLVLEVPGLSYASNLDARATETGYVVFTRSFIP